MTDTAFVAICGVITTIAGFWFQGRQMNRKFQQSEAQAARARAWQIEDTRRTAYVLAQKTERVAAELREETLISRDAFQAHAEEMAVKMDHNTRLTDMAYNAANNFELKLEQLARVFDSSRSDRSVADTLNAVKELSKDTNDLVRKELQPEVPETIKELIQHRDDHVGKP